MITSSGFPSEFLTSITINNQCSVPITVYFNTAGRTVLAMPGVHTYNVFFLPAPPLPYQLIYENQIIGMGVLTSSTLTISNCPTLVSSSPSSPTSTPVPSTSTTPWILLGLATVAGIGLIVYHESRKR